MRHPNVFKINHIHKKCKTNHVHSITYTTSSLPSIPAGSDVIVMAHLCCRYLPRKRIHNKTGGGLPEPTRAPCREETTPWTLCTEMTTSTPAKLHLKHPTATPPTPTPLLPEALVSLSWHTACFLIETESSDCVLLTDMAAVVFRCHSSQRSKQNSWHDGADPYIIHDDQNYNIIILIKKQKHCWYLSYLTWIMNQLFSKQFPQYYFKCWSSVCIDILLSQTDRLYICLLMIVAAIFRCVWIFLGV